jgi:LPXTG-motif cell wall-anchored protein
MGVALIGVLGLFVLPMTTAGAQTTTTAGPTTTTAGPSVGATSCSFSVTGTSPNFEIKGTGAPAQSTVTLYFTPTNTGVKSAVATQPGPSFDFFFTAPSSGTFSVGYVTTDGGAYTAVCATVAGEVVVAANEATRPAAALAFTGSSNTPSYVIIGIAAIVVGTILVMAARRRRQVS